MSAHLVEYLRAHQEIDVLSTVNGPVFNPYYAGRISLPTDAKSDQYSPTPGEASALNPDRQKLQ